MSSEHVKLNTPNRSERAEIQIAKLLTEEFSGTKSPVLVAVGGPGGVGKSTFAAKLSMELDDCTTLHLDDYKVDNSEKREHDVSGPHPKANKMELVLFHLKELKENRAISKPCFNQMSGVSDGLIDDFAPAKFILVEGEISTYAQFSELIDFSIYIDAHWKTQLNTRINRDITVRGYSVDEAISTFLKSNIQEFEEFGSNTKRDTDLCLWCESDYRLELSHARAELLEKYRRILCADHSNASLEKVFVAATTPFREDLTIDSGALSAHLRYLETKGVDAIFLGGTTGEFETLTFEEKKELLYIGRHNFSGTITFNVSSTSLHESLELVKVAEKGGANAITALPPYYRAKVGDEGVVEFFNTISASTELPFIIYNFTRHTQNEVPGELLSKINAVAVKDSDKNFDMIPFAPLYLCAGDSIIAEAVSHGAKGVVSVQGNYRPAEILKLFNISKSDPQKASALQKDAADVSALFRKTKQIARIKQALSEIIPGYPAFVRLPLVTLNANEKSEITEWCNSYTKQC